MSIYINKNIPKQPPEKDDGNKEYKRYLINHPKNDINILLKKDLLKCYTE